MPELTIDERIQKYLDGQLPDIDGEALERFLRRRLEWLRRTVVGLSGAARSINWAADGMLSVTVGAAIAAVSNAYDKLRREARRRKLEDVANHAIRELQEAANQAATALGAPIVFPNVTSTPAISVTFGTVPNPASVISINLLTDSDIETVLDMMRAALKIRRRVENAHKFEPWDRTPPYIATEPPEGETVL